MRKLSVFFSLAIVFFFCTSCDKKRVTELETMLAAKEGQVKQLENQLSHLQGSNASLLDRLSDLSVINKTGSASIQKSLESMTQQYSFIEKLSTKIQSKDSLNLALVMNIKRSLVDINDEDVQVEVKGGVVYVSISDKLLYAPGSIQISAQAQKVLAKLATVLNDHADMNVLVEGHTDDEPIANNCMKDNWDLSVQRATGVVRVLSDKYEVSPERLTAAGRSKYVPKTMNNTPEERSLNRRTEIIITPKLDQFFKLMEAPLLNN